MNYSQYRFNHWINTDPISSLSLEVKNFIYKRLNYKLVNARSKSFDQTPDFCNKVIDNLQKLINQKSHNVPNSLIHQKSKLV